MRKERIIFFFLSRLCSAAVAIQSTNLNSIPLFGPVETNFSLPLSVELASQIDGVIAIYPTESQTVQIGIDFSLCPESAVNETFQYSYAGPEASSFSQAPYTSGHWITKHEKFLLSAKDTPDRYRSFIMSVLPTVSLYTFGSFNMTGPKRLCFEIRGNVVVFTGGVVSGGVWFYSNRIYNSMKIVIPTTECIILMTTTLNINITSSITVATLPASDMKLQLTDRPESRIIYIESGSYTLDYTGGNTTIAQIHVLDKSFEVSSVVTAATDFRIHDIFFSYIKIILMSDLIGVGGAANYTLTKEESAPSGRLPINGTIHFLYTNSEILIDTEAAILIPLPLSNAVTLLTTTRSGTQESIDFGTCVYPAQPLPHSTFQSESACPLAQAMIISPDDTQVHVSRGMLAYLISTGQEDKMMTMAGVTLEPLQALVSIPSIGQNIRFSNSPLSQGFLTVFAGNAVRHIQPGASAQFSTVGAADLVAIVNLFSSGNVTFNVSVDEGWAVDVSFGIMALGMANSIVEYVSGTFMLDTAMCQLEPYLTTPLPTLTQSNSIVIPCDIFQNYKAFLSISTWEAIQPSPSGLWSPEGLGDLSVSKYKKVSNASNTFPPTFNALQYGSQELITIGYNFNPYLQPLYYLNTTGLSVIEIQIWSNTSNRPLLVVSGNVPRQSFSKGKGLVSTSTEGYSIFLCVEFFDTTFIQVQASATAVMRLLPRIVSSQALLTRHNSIPSMQAVNTFLFCAGLSTSTLLYWQDSGIYANPVNLLFVVPSMSQTLPLEITPFEYNFYGFSFPDTTDGKFNDATLVAHESFMDSTSSNLGMTSLSILPTDANMNSMILNREQVYTSGEYITYTLYFKLLDSDYFPNASRIDLLVAVGGAGIFNYRASPLSVLLNNSNRWYFPRVNLTVGYNYFDVKLPLKECPYNFMAVVCPTMKASSAMCDFPLAISGGEYSSSSAHCEVVIDQEQSSLLVFVIPALMFIVLMVCVCGIFRFCSSRAVPESPLSRPRQVSTPIVFSTASESFVHKHGFGANDEEDLCAICLDADRNTLILPCRHYCVCDECAKKVKLCPLCRNKITECKVLTKHEAANEVDGD